MLIKLKERGTNKAKDIGTTDGPTNAPQAMLVIADERGPVVDSSEIADELHTSEEKVEREFRRWVSMGLAEDMGGESSRPSRHVVHTRPAETEYDSNGHGTSTGEKVANTAVNVMKGLGKLAVGTVKYVNKKGLEGIFIGNTEAITGPSRRQREMRRLERVRRDRARVLRGREE